MGVPTYKIQFPGTPLSGKIYFLVVVLLIFSFKWLHFWALDSFTKKSGHKFGKKM